VHSKPARKPFYTLGNLVNFFPKWIRVINIFTQVEEPPFISGNLPVRKTVSLRCFAQGRAVAEKIMISHPCAVFRAELFYYRLNQIVPLVPGKVNINVRRVRAGGVKKALKIKVMPYRIDIGNSKRI